MAFNKTFNQEEVARLKKLVNEGMQVHFEMDALKEGLRDTVKAIAEEMDLKPSILMKAIFNIWYCASLKWCSELIYELR